MRNSNKPIFTVRPTAYRAWDGKQMLPVDSLCWNAMGALWYAPGAKFGWAWINPNFDGWNKDNPKPTDKDIYPVMQWTGLRDKDGKDIYEGDIIFDEYTMSMKRFQTVQFEFGQWVVTDDKYFEPLLRTEYAQVVGNIFQNPELLES